MKKVMLYVCNSQLVYLSYSAPVPWLENKPVVSKSADPLVVLTLVQVCFQVTFLHKSIPPICVWTQQTHNVSTMFPRGAWNNIGDMMSLKRCDIFTSSIGH